MSVRNSTSKAIYNDDDRRNIKARVTDGDVEGLIPAKNLAQVELLYNAGARDSPQYGMTSLLEARGAGLTSVALVSKMLSVMNVKVSEQRNGLDLSIFNSRLFP